MQEERQKAREEQMREHEAKDASKQTKQSKAIVISATRRDAEAQWQGVTIMSGITGCAVHLEFGTQRLTQWTQ